MKNTIFESRIKYWENRNPIWKKVFDRQEKSYKLIEFVARIIEIVETVPGTEVLSYYDFVNFIDGLAMVPLINGKEDSKEASKVKELTDPTLNYLRKLFSSRHWRKFMIMKEISGDEILKIDGMEIPMSLEQILLHAERLNAYPILREHVAAIEVDLVKYKRKQFSQPPEKPNRIIKTGILEAIYALFHDEVFEVEEDDFIQAINDPVNFGHLIKPKIGKQTYMYYLIGQISVHIQNQQNWEELICNALGYSFDSYRKKKSGSYLPHEFKDQFKFITVKRG